MADNAKVLSVVSEALVTPRVYSTQVNTVVSEYLIGNSFGYSAITTPYSVVMEVLVKTAPIYVQSVVLEALVFKPSDNQSQARIAASFFEAALMKRPKMALPSTIRSPITVVTYGQQVVRKRSSDKPHSMSSVAAVREQVVMDRKAPTAPNMWSMLSTGSLYMQVVRSRNRSYVPVSALYTAAARQQVVMKRAVSKAPNVRSMTRVPSHYELIVQSRVKGAVVIMTDAFVFKMRQQIVAATHRVRPISQESVAGLRELVVMKRSLTGNVDDRVAALRQQVVVKRLTGIQRSPESVAELVQQVMLKRRTFPPEFSTGRNVKQMRELVVMERTLPALPIRGSIDAGSLRLSFVLERTVPAPIDVIDPAIGRHVATYAQVTVQHRNTLPPDTLNRQLRFVRALTEQLVLRDSFPLPPYPEPDKPEQRTYALAEQIVTADPEDWEIVTALTVSTVATVVAHHDDAQWSNPFGPFSDVDAFAVVEHVVHRDHFPLPDELHSDDLVSSLTEVVVHGDHFPDALMAQSAAMVHVAGELLVVGDDEGWADPAVPVSELDVMAVREHVVIHDDALSGKFEMSEIHVQNVARVIVFNDPSLVGIAKRTGPRPVVSVSIS